VAFFGLVNSLVQTVLKICSPGVPDFYQGTELTALTLVDPDNRRRVDFTAAAQRLDAAGLWEEEGRVANRLYVIRKLLQLRRDDPELFAQGDYQALQVDGVHKEHVLAFARTHQNRSCIVVVPRWTAKLMDGATELPLGSRVWGDTKIAVGSAARTTDVLTDRQVTIGSERTLSVADVFAEFPVAVLVGQASA
jgi:(1->4)-alpha-D-glucan 1-alpha-D-glucosylmutase